MDKAQKLIDEMLQQFNDRENGFAIIDEKGKFKVPVRNSSGIVVGYNEPTDGDIKYRGYVLEINDHGNVTIWYQFKNGNRREIASRV